MSDDAFKTYLFVGCEDEALRLWGFPDRPGDPGTLYISLLLTKTHHRYDDCWRCRIRHAWYVLRGHPWGELEFYEREQVLQFSEALGHAANRVWPERSAP